MTDPTATVGQMDGLEVVIRRGTDVDEVYELRRRVFRDELRQLSDSDIASKDDALGSHVCLYRNGKLAGAALGIAAEQSSFPVRTGVAPSGVRGMYYVTRVMLAPEERRQGLAALLVYCLFREGRILGRKTAVGLFSESDAVPAVLTNAVPFRGLPSVHYTGHEGYSFELRSMIAEINYGMHCCWNRLRSELRDLAVKRLLTDEVIRTVLLETDRFYKNPWFQRVEAGTLTRGQYVEFLANNYQFVQWTTRILGRAVGLAENSDLRNHYIQHLSGEIDHEKYIESDLDYLGADIEYVRRHMTACVDIGHFMGVQEAIIGFRADPVTLLAIPIAIESLTAHLSGNFLSNLEICVRNWGYSEPSRATKYLRTHLPVDGGDDGHWARTGQVIPSFLKTETETQRFVGLVRMVIVALDRALSSYVEYPDFT